MKALSKIAIMKNKDIIERIHRHPFNLELSIGKLDKDIFNFYIDQDTIYLRDFSRTLALIAGRIKLEFVDDFLRFSQGALIAEQEVVHEYFRKKDSYIKNDELTQATISYTSFLLNISANRPVEIGVAAILPCFWVYLIVGLNIKENSNDSDQNPYSKWIDTYSSKEFKHSVKRAIEIFDELGRKASKTTQLEMLDTFRKSTIFEWHFWNDAYHKRLFDQVIST